MPSSAFSAGVGASKICFTHSPGSSGEHVRDMLGLSPRDDAVLLSDGYTTYASFAKPVGLTHAQCWASITPTGQAIMYSEIEGRGADSAVRPVFR
jgi:hypothetical protein